MWKPTEVIGPGNAPYLLRWHLIPHNRYLNIYLHKFLRSDDDRALHDHPWASLSIMLKGQYLEYTHKHQPHEISPHRYICNEYVVKHFRAWKYYFWPAFKYRPAKYTHRIELIDNRPCWTLFITGPKVRDWGFHCPKGWRIWRQYVEKVDKTGNTKGCE